MDQKQLLQQTKSLKGFASLAKVLNRERLRKKLSGLPEDIRSMIVPAMSKGAQSIVDFAIHLAPVDKGALRNSIDWCFGNPPSSARLSSIKKNKPSLTEKDLVVSVFAGNDRAFYARWVEFGTQPSTKGGRVPDNRKGGGATRKSYRTHPGTKAQPFFYPAYRAYKGTVSRSIKSATSRAIAKAGGVEAVAASGD